MKKNIKKNIILLFLFFLPICSLFIGFVMNEDLSTGGAKLDFNVTWPLINNYSNLNFITDDITTHMPLKDVHRFISKKKDC